MFRIYRDTRFSKDKSPYKTHVGVQFPLREGVHTPRLLPPRRAERVVRCRGVWMPDAESLLAIRDAIAGRSAEWRKASGDLDEDEGALKRPPRGLTPTTR